jgi:hypothetical protein
MCIITHSTDAFTWVPQHKYLVAERSDFTETRTWTVVKEGNLDVPYCYLRNPKTGNKVLFVFLRTEESNGPDYEIETWVFGPTPEEIEKNPRLFGLEVLFRND